MAHHYHHTSMRGVMITSTITPPNIPSIEEAREVTAWARKAGRKRGVKVKAVWSGPFLTIADGEKFVMVSWDRLISIHPRVREGFINHIMEDLI